MIHFNIKVIHREKNLQLPTLPTCAFGFVITIYFSTKSIFKLLLETKINTLSWLKNNEISGYYNEEKKC